MSETIGFIGLGNMGSGMAANLLSAGHDVGVFNRSPGKAAALTERGAIAAPTIAAVCHTGSTPTSDPISGMGPVPFEPSATSSMTTAVWMPPSMQALRSSRRFSSR